jgi:hypothetical protein
MRSPVSTRLNGRATAVGERGTRQDGIQPLIRSEYRSANSFPVTADATRLVRPPEDLILMGVQANQDHPATATLASLRNTTLYVLLLT